MTGIGDRTRQWAQAYGLKCFYAAQTDSTNRVAKSFGIEPNFQRVLFVADHQTRGRGRGEHSWTSSQGQQLLGSWVFYSQQKFRHITPQLFGLGLYLAARQVYPALPWGLKAPNDLFLGEKKVAGILIEIVTGGPAEQLIAGVGMNILSHPDPVTTATHLLQHEPNALEKWPEFLTQVTENFTQAAEQAVLPQMNEVVQDRLLDALNSFALLRESYTQVDAEGNLSTSTRHIRWTDL